MQFPVDILPKGLGKKVKRKEKEKRKKRKEKWWKRRR
jgi:hypothetical protein